MRWRSSRRRSPTWMRPSFKSSTSATPRCSPRPRAGSDGANSRQNNRSVAGSYRGVVDSIPLKQPYPAFVAQRPDGRKLGTLDVITPRPHEARRKRVPRVAVPFLPKQNAHRRHTRQACPRRARRFGVRLGARVDTFMTELFLRNLVLLDVAVNRPIRAAGEKMPGLVAPQPFAIFCHRPPPENVI